MYRVQYYRRLVALHLVVANNIRIRRRNLSIRTSLRGPRNTLLLRRLRRHRLVVSSRGCVAGVARAVVHAVGLVLVMRRLDIDVGDSAIFAVAREGFVFVGRLGELGNNVPGVEEAGDVAEDAEEDVDEGVCAADAALDPD